MSSVLDALKKKANKTPSSPLIFLYGSKGVGKTAFAAANPNSAIFYASKERGITDLIAAGVVDPEYPHYELPDWETLRSATKELATAEVPFKRIFFDTATEFQQLLFEFECNRNFDGQWEGKGGFIPWDAGPKAAFQEWTSWLDDLTPILDRGIAVYILGHAKARRVDDPMVDSYDRWEPDLFVSKKMSDLAFGSVLMNRATEIGFMHREVLTGEGEATQTGKRYIRFDEQATWEAKSRYGIGMVDMGKSAREAAQNYGKAVTEAVKRNHEARKAESNG